MRTQISLALSAALLAAFVPSSLTAQDGPARRVVPMDTARARMLYVSNRPEDHPVADYARHIAAKAVTDSIFAARSRGVMQYRKVTYRSPVDGLEIPAYVYAPLNPRGDRAHAAMVWVHGGSFTTGAANDEAAWDPAIVARLAEVWRAGGWPAEPDASGTALTAPFSAQSAGRPPWRTTASDTLPSNARAGPVRAWVLITIRSQDSDCAVRRISCAGWPTATRYCRSKL